MFFFMFLKLFELGLLLDGLATSVDRSLFAVAACGSSLKLGRTACAPTMDSWSSFVNSSSIDDFNCTHLSRQHDTSPHALISQSLASCTISNLTFGISFPSLFCRLPLQGLISTAAGAVVFL